MFLLVDNYDSFTWNIYHSISGMGIKVIVKRNDKIYKNEITKKYKGIIFSPGPGHPKDSSEMMDLIKNTIIRHLFGTSSISLILWC